jgi:pilus assembly protein CpaF
MQKTAHPELVEGQLRDEVRKQLSARRPAGGSWSPDEVRRALSEAAGRLGGQGLPPESVLESVFADLVGLGPLDELLARPGVQEILVNGPAEIFIEVTGGEAGRRESEALSGSRAPA